MYKVISVLLIFIVLCCVIVKATNVDFSFQKFAYDLSRFQYFQGWGETVNNILRTQYWYLSDDWGAFNFLRDFFNAIIGGVKGIIMFTVIVSDGAYSLIMLYSQIIVEVFMGLPFIPDSVGD